MTNDVRVVWLGANTCARERSFDAGGGCPGWQDTSSESGRFAEQVQPTRVPGDLAAADDENEATRVRSVDQQAAKEQVDHEEP